MLWLKEGCDHPNEKPEVKADERHCTNVVVGISR
jgi:hypothetical protein